MATAHPTIHQRRIVVAAAICVAAFALLGVRLVDISVFKGNVSGVSGTAGDEVMRVRADIVDRNGELLARDLPVYDVYARPHAFWDRKEAAHDLSVATGASEKRLERIFNSKHTYVLVARRLTPAKQDKVMQLGLPGLDFVQADKRFYPKGRAAVQVIGTTDPDGNGLTGLEYGLNRRLENAEPGDQVKLSLDMRVQFALSHELEMSREEFNARAAGGIVMNVNNGEILAMASLPDSTFGTLPPGVDPRRNRMTQDVYELGSVFKLFAFALAMEDHTARLDEMLPISAGYRMGRFVIRDAERLPAMLSVRDVLAVSSNVGTVQIALRSGPARQQAFLRNMGLLDAAQLEVPESARPLTPRNWGPVETATIGFGHGISVSPVAFATAASILVNGGRRITPTFLKRAPDTRGEQVIKPETSATMRQLLRYVVTNGTGRSADVPGYEVGGKTGSAEKPGKHGYVEHKLLTSFCAVFPISNPKYLVFVLMDEPHGTKKTFGFALAAYTAAPAARRVIARIAPMMGMPPTEPVQLAAKEIP